MTFDEACERFVPAPFDTQYMWLDITEEADPGGIRDILLVDGYGGTYFCQIMHVSPNMVDPQFRPWSLCDLDAPAYVEQNRVWNIGTLQEIIQYTRRRSRI